MTDRPIIFSAPMVRALLDGRKTQTRRAIKRLGKFGTVAGFSRSSTRGYNWQFRDRRMRWNDVINARLMQLLPVHVGDRLWVREAGIELRHAFDHDPIAGTDLWSTVGWEHAADGAIVELEECNPPLSEWKDDCSLIKRPSIHMPKWASRLTLVVSDVRVQRLQDITPADAIAEGCRMLPDGPGAGFWIVEHTDICADGAVECYRSLWDKINGEDSWQANPWVAAYSFDVHRCNIADAPHPVAR